MNGKGLPRARHLDSRLATGTLPLRLREVPSFFIGVAQRPIRVVNPN